MKRGEQPSLQARAESHPDYAEFEARLSDIGSVSPEDALHPDHVEIASEDAASAEAKMYFFQQLLDADAGGWSAQGTHLRKPQELAATYRIPIERASQICEDARMEAEAFYLNPKLRRLGDTELQDAIRLEIQHLKVQKQKAA